MKTENNKSIALQKTGRPRVDPSNKKVNTNVWLKKAQYQELKDRAQAAGLTYSAYCEKLLTQKSPRFYSNDYSALKSEVNKIGQNINQLIKHYHMNKENNFSARFVGEITQRLLDEFYEFQQLIGKEIEDGI